MQDKYARYNQAVTWTQNGPVRVSRPAQHVAAARLTISPTIIFILAAFVILTAAVILAGLTVFEDGSFGLFSISGCLPGAICNL